jgi:predicted ATPase/transcriptional regulator with XRE-family HTH domain
MADSQPVQLGQVIRRFRLASGMSQEQLAERSGLSARSVSDLERGLRSGTRPETLRMLAEALSLSEEERDALLLAARPELKDLHSPDKVTSSPRTSWPEPRTQLIGREREVGEVVQRLTGRARIVTLTGPGGVGKTSVALEAGRRFSQTSGSDACFVDLSPIVNPDLVIPTIALALGIAEPRERSIIDALVLALQQRHVLLLLDNFEQVIAAAPVVGELVERARDVHVLVTSRETLRIRDEWEIVIDPLSLPHTSDNLERLRESASIALFVSAAMRADPAFALDGENVSAVAGICQRLDGLPLAIELAASRVRYFPPGLLLERMERRLPVLTGGRRDLPARQQTLRNAIAWSYGLLSPDEQELFRRIGAFPSGATLEALDAFSQVAGGADLDLLSGLASLVDKHLVRETMSAAGTPRFSMLETIREFAGEMIAESDEAEVARDAVLAHVTAIARSGESAFRTWFYGPAAPSELDGEIGNIRLAFDIAADRNDADAFAQLYLGMSGYFFRRGLYQEAFDLGERAIELARNKALPHPVPVRLLNRHAGFRGLGLDTSGAERLLREGLILAEKRPPDTTDLVEALSVLVMVVRDQDRYEEALTYAERADELAARGEAESFRPLTKFAIGKDRVSDGRSGTSDRVPQ